MARCAAGSTVNAPEIIPADHSGGATTSHTIVIAALEALLAAVGTAGAFADFERAVLEDTSSVRTRLVRVVGRFAISASSMCSGKTRCSSARLAT